MFIFIAEHNGLVAWSAYIPSAYLEALTKEHVCIIASPEFGPLEGHLLIIVWALYGLYLSGARWHDRLADILRNEGFIPCHAEPDIWMHPNGDLYENIAIYADHLESALKLLKDFLNS